ncbi:ATP-binding cassette domain-containing protein [candidate division KSB3 bacterium]|jgi:polar amino acid transport system ATP-binding protein|uniref:ATP-binding cassette domain-containing protein n=1 Tax=candidate division KSB3 bacterium TaxID=2044937 RepID=A0A9D5Q543_9BACT|nr:ATP-binding cassette domain-containing protein [candidate division KSB3 bacterium]MBD3324195.1 ATP-binding cassette domain-containing protein [candidate division KSB3 bacterium]
MTASQPIVRIRNLMKSFGQHQVLKGIDLEVQRGEVVVIIGPSGSGKTTMLRCVNALETYDGGSIEVDGVEIGYRTMNGKRKRRSDRELSAIRADIGMVFQLFNLFPHLTALDNVMLGLTKVHGMDKAKAREVATTWLNRVGLSDKLDSVPAQLSGGQQQRVGIARAVAMDPKILLLDEITSSLDPELIGEVLEVVLQLAKDGMTMLCVTHEISFAQDIATRVMFIDEGVIIAEGTPEEIIINPQQERLRTFLSRFQNINKYAYDK